MERNGRLLLWALAALALSAPSAEARWLANATGPDVFGDINAMAGVSGTKGDVALVIQCSNAAGVTLAFTDSASPSTLDKLAQGPVPAKLLIRVDDGDVKTFDAEAKKWNPTRMAIVVEDVHADLIPVVHAIGAAKKSINVGFEIGGTRESDNFVATGSTDAMKTVIEKCELPRPR